MVTRVEGREGLLEIEAVVALEADAGRQALGREVARRALQDLERLVVGAALAQQACERQAGVRARRRLAAALY